MPILSIIMPAYNEADLIGDSLTKLNHYLSQEMATTEIEVIVVINSPASDGTLAAAESTLQNLEIRDGHNFIIHDAKKRLGKGGAVKLGMSLAEGEYKLFIDTDLSTPPEHIGPALSLIESADADVLIGVRDIENAHETKARRLSSRASNLAVRLLILPKFKDTQCGFKMFKASAASLIFSKLTSMGWSFDMEALLIAETHHLKTIEMPIPDWHDPKADGLTGDNTLVVMLKELKELARFTINNLTNKYK